jgi:hypothetical protein
MKLKHDDFLVGEIPLWEDGSAQQVRWSFILEPLFQLGKLVKRTIMKAILKYPLHLELVREFAGSMRWLGGGQVARVV